MKRNCLLAKSLALGLAVATAAASMSVPGGLVAPEVVRAQEDMPDAKTSEITFEAMSEEVYTAGYGSLTGTKPTAVTDFGDAEPAADGTTIKFTGTAKYVGNFTGFNAAETEEQSGYYVAWQFGVPTDIKDTAVYYLESKQADNVTETLEGHSEKYFKKLTKDNLDTPAGGSTSYFSCITRISDLNGSRELVIDWDGDDATGAEMTTYAMDFSQVKFESAITETDNLTKAWDDASAATAADTGIASVFKKEAFKTADEAAADALEIKWYEGEVAKEGLTDATPVTDISALTEAGVYTYAASYKEDSRYTSESVIGQVKVGVDLSEATIALSKTDDGEAATAFDYTGEPIEPVVKVTVGEGTALDAQKYEVRYSADDADTAPFEAGTAFAEVGSYKLWVVPSETGVGSCYNSNAATYSISAVEVTEDNIADYLSYTDIAAGILTYSGEDQAQAVADAVTVQDDYTDKIQDFTISFKKQGGEDDFLTELVDAGTYDVYAEIAGNIATKAPVKIGTAVVDQYTVTVTDITVAGKTVTYNEGAFSVEPASVSELLDAQKVKITYKKDDTTDVVNPTNAGTYNVYVAYEGDGNCKVLAETKTDNVLTIAKATDDSKFSQYMIKKDNTEEATYELSEMVTHWALDGTDTNIDATVTVADEELKKYFAGDPSYDVGNKALKFTLSSEAANITDNTTVNLRVDFGNSFTNWEVAFTIPIVITTKDPVAIDVANANLKYTGNAINLTYTIRDGDGGFTEITGKTISEINEGCVEGEEKLKVTITKDGAAATEVKDAGRYVVTGVYNDGTYYGEFTWDGYVEPKKVSDLDGLMTFSAPALSYNMKDQKADILGAVSVAADIDIAAGDYEVSISEAAAVNVGSYDVYVAFTDSANYASDDQIKIGTATINKGTITLTVTADAQGTPTIKVDGTTISNTDRHVTLAYYQDSTNLGTTAPTDPGTYKVVVTYTDSDNLSEAATGEAPFTIAGSGTGGDSGPGSGDSGSGSGSGSGGSSSGSGSTGTENKPGTGTQTKPDETKVETSTETNASGNTVEITTTTKTDSTGAVTSIVEKSVIAESSSTTSTTVTVKKNGEGEITSAAASISNTVASGNKATVSAALVSQITEAAGTDDVKITMTVRDADGNTKYKLKVDAEDLKAGEDLYLYKLNTKTGEYVMVDAKTYGVSKSGSVAVSIKNKATYELVDYAQSAKITNEIKSTIKPQKSSVSVKKNKNTTFALSKKANKSNIKSITYTTSKKSVATVSKSGKISAKGKGTATVKAKVTLKNGATKTIKMTIKVK